MCVAPPLAPLAASPLDAQAHPDQGGSAAPAAPAEELPWQRSHCWVGPQPLAFLESGLLLRSSLHKAAAGKVVLQGSLGGALHAAMRDHVVRQMRMRMAHVWLPCISAASLHSI